MIVVQMPDTKAIEFAEWLGRKRIKVDREVDGKLCWYRYIQASHTDMGTTEELYHKFLKEKYEYNSINKPKVSP